jgi:hypothetical protein
MYSPKISEGLVPILYRLGKARKMPMTQLVSELIHRALKAEPLPDEIKAMLPTKGESNAVDQVA